jgi:hypothetical protein
MELKTNVIPVITGATGNISKSFIKYLSNIPERHNFKELQKTVILATAHKLRELLMQKHKIFITGNNTTCTIYCNHRIAATLYTLDGWFVSSIQL